MKEERKMVSRTAQSYQGKKRSTKQQKLQPTAGRSSKLPSICACMLDGNQYCIEHHVKITYRQGGTKIYFQWPANHRCPAAEVKLQAVNKELWRIGQIVKSCDVKTTGLCSSKEVLEGKILKN